MRSRIAEPSLASPMLDADGLSAIEALYNAPLREDAWRDFLEILRDRFRAHSVFLAFQLHGEDDYSLQIQASQSDIRAFTQRYFSTFARENPIQYRSMIAGKVYRLEDFIASGCLNDSTLYRDHLRPEGLGTVEVVKIGRHDGPQAYLAWLREADRGGLDDLERAWLCAILPHAERAVTIFSRFRLNQRLPELLAKMFDRLSFGALAISRSGRLVFINALAERLIGQSEALSIRQDHLVFRDPAQGRLVEQLASHPSMIDALQMQERVLNLGDDRSKIAALLAPIDIRDVFDTAMPASLMIYLHDLRRTARASAALVGKLFGLAPAEARLAILLGEGLTLRAAAARMGITENSVRSYCKNIFQKAGLSRQTDIVRLIQQSIAIFAE